MSTSRDFGSASESGSDERRRKQQNRFMMAGATASIMLILAVVGVATVQYNSEADESSTSPSDGGLESTSHFRTTSAIQVICSPTDYKSSCESSLSKYVNESSKPKDLVRAAVLAVVDGVSKAFNRSDSIKSDDPEVKAAIADCKEMHQYAVDELAKTLSHIDEHHLKQLPKQIPELKNWLSAVVAYQQTCIDGFPEGKLKSKMQAAMKSAKEITSNALVIPAEPAWYVDGNPSWASHGDRRLLQTSATPQFTPNVTVAKDGSGDFTTISGALAKAPKKLLHGRYVIYVKEGVYEETVEVDKNTWNITMYGDGEQKTIVTGSKNFIDGVKTYHTATFAAIGDGFMAVDMAFLNTAGANKHQAVALRVQADRAIFLQCRMEAYQDTLYAHSHRQFYRDCLISGTIDFIFGDASAVFQHCILTVRRPLNNQQNIVLAQGRSVLQESTGFVIHNCRIVAIPALADAKPKFRNYLGRPWQEFSNTYNNKGPGADTSKRVNWAGFKVISQEEASAYTVAPFIQGDDWISKMGAPVRLGLYNE
ncbi:pectinesterase [Musa troglodytarum]|uniref:Pectinesterase n=1 Tax=Musa troglodytarum TaxID=320322 RepID=A0A9E7KYV6_9LILI|nr:pectinesterase [Musa troglodytarum]